jgi:PAS domain S-box-containing protein
MTEIEKIYDESDTLIFCVDKDQKFVFFNRAWLAFRNEELLRESGSGVAAFVHEKDSPALLRALDRVSEKLEPVQTEFRLLSGTGNYQWFSAIINPLFIDGRFSGFSAHCSDISEKKSLEERDRSLIALENTLLNIFDNLSRPFCLFELAVNQDGSEDLLITMANREFAELNKTPYETIVGKLFSEVCLGGADFLQSYISTAKTRAPSAHEAYNYFDKKYLNDISFSPEPGKVAIIITDRTQLVEAERALKDREEDLALVFMSFAFGFCLGRIVKDENGEPSDIFFEMANQAFALLEGAETSSINGQPLSESGLEVSEEHFNYMIDVALNRKKIYFEKFIPSNGCTLAVTCYSPKPDYFVLIENDVSARIKAEENLQKSYRDTEAILDEVMAPVIVVRKADGAILSYNTAFSDMYAEKQRGDLVGTPITKRFEIEIDDGKCGDFMSKLKDNICFRGRMENANGRLVEVEVYQRLITFRDQEAYAVHCVDLTRQIIEEQALREALDAAEEASRMKSAFLANMSHEIRTPLNGIIGFTELALDSGDVSATSKNYLQKIKVSAVVLLEIINDILDLSKIEAGKVELEKIPFSLHAVFKQCEMISAIKAMEKGINLYFYSEPFVGQKFLGDPTKLRQVLLNLLSNAIKFTDVGTVKLLTTAEKYAHDAIKLNFEVKDTGIGMSTEQIKRIFEPFTQADGSTTRKYGGTGLGLSITKNIIELMGGELQVESSPGAGSKFSFSLIFEVSNEPDEICEDEDMPLAAGMRPTFDGDVLVCEDNQMNREVIEGHLGRLGLRATMAENGEIGVSLALERMKERRPYDIILMDIHMPVMDGLEASKKLIDAGIQTPIIAMTANVMTKDMEIYGKHGMKGYIGKPFIAHELWRCLLQFMTPVKMTPTEQASEGCADEKGAAVKRSVGMKMVSGDEKLYNRLKSDFFKNNRGAYEELTNALAAGDVVRAHRMAHTLKGTSGLIGATRLQEAARDLETALSGCSGHYDEGHTRRLEEALKEVLEELAPAAEQRRPAPSSRGVLDKARATALFDRLEPLLRKGDYECVSLLDETKNVLSPLGESGDRLASLIEDYDFDLAWEALARLKETLETQNGR